MAACTERDHASRLLSGRLISRVARALNLTPAGFSRRRCPFFASVSPDVLQLFHDLSLHFRTLFRAAHFAIADPSNAKRTPTPDTR